MDSCIQEAYHKSRQNNFSNLYTVSYDGMTLHTSLLFLRRHNLIMSLLENDVMRRQGSRVTEVTEFRSNSDKTTDVTGSLEHSAEDSTKE